jgi:hypothetical protein
MKTAPSPQACAAEGCGNTFTPNERGRPRLYCDDCSTKTAYNRRWRKGETHAPAAEAVRSPASPRGEALAGKAAA